MDAGTASTENVEEPLLRKEFLLTHVWFATNSATLPLGWF